MSLGRGLLSLGFLFLLGCTTSGKIQEGAQTPTSQATDAEVRNVEVQGHRGTRGTHPENSLLAFEEAVRVGVDVLELDLGVTKDGVLVITHDPYIDPEQCTTQDKKRLKDKIPLATLTLEQVKTFRCGELAHPRFPRQKKILVRIPTLREFLVALSTWPGGAQVRLNIETKIAPGYPEMTPEPKAYAKMVVDILREFKQISKTTLQSFDHRTLSEAKLLEPSLTLSPLFESNYLNFTLIAQDLGAKVISPNHLWITKEEVAKAHAAGIRVIPWTLNDEREWARALDFNFDGIITDYPEKLIAYLKTRGLRK